MSNVDWSDVIDETSGTELSYHQFYRNIIKCHKIIKMWTNAMANTWNFGIHGNTNCHINVVLAKKTYNLRTLS